MNKQAKNRIVIITIALTIVGLWISYQQLDLNRQTTQASIDYSIDNNGSTRLYTFGSSAVTINCRNGGGIDGNFYLVVKFTNASFSDETTMPYIRVNNTLVKSPFLLHKSGASMDSNSKAIFFTIDEGVSGFSISVTLEKYDQNPLKANPIYPTELEYRWNEQNKSYDQFQNKG
jgi:hypothetical protein